MTAKNVFVLALTDVQRGELETVNGAENYVFRNLLDYESVVNTPEIDFEGLLAKARSELQEFDGPVDAIVTHWDFPASVIGPLLAKENGLPAPSLESLLKCEHKYWSRLEQKASIPECVPQFASFDPFDDDALSKIDIEYPFWVKPVKSHSSNLGFEIQNEEQFNEAVQEIRDQIEQIGDAFNDVLAMVDLPPELRNADGNTCLAEGFISGTQAAPEGTMFGGKFQVHGVFDMHKDEAGTSFERLDYPANSVPESVQQRMIDLTERYMHHVGFDNGCFNAEFMWDEAEDKLWLVEVNTRISQSHSDLFAKVDGVSNHEVAIDIALDREPKMPYRKGNFAVASQCMIFHDEDAVVTRVPSAEDKAAIRERYPETTVTLQVKEGEKLSELPGQDSYRYILGKLYIGADNRDQLVERYNAILSELPFEFAPVDQPVNQEGAA
ncbi:ATP-grasp domain-containing protein [Arthrobacter crystallopoietes]|uniref:ATP-grasp domain-containing protein n=1 Tax=Crystallibacter crystallopoietes TaxID=37928 RepID=UPI001ABE10A5|nr:ATP-grasp domain-containing protein [Arthrobacter crystallopoietes]QTG80120.1 ATP-grasp domain-containing protein [Arthrobacter crystallopoietes]